jgi:hypothetical protein
MRRENTFVKYPMTHLREPKFNIQKRDCCFPKLRASFIINKLNHVKLVIGN